MQLSQTDAVEPLDTFVGESLDAHAPASLA